MINRYLADLRCCAILVLETKVSNVYDRDVGHFSGYTVTTD